ncbi:unnamed protein product [Heligmosomoides polygyrus]|uniref:Galectin n=1 Tax=Heligmosomoides polygyrus TaxID=6339 RepID=A0A183GQ70_HELPZ|nr:unnamed protein product [Heligmosomoides polygyrus]
MIGAGVGARSIEVYNSSNPTEIHIPGFDNGKRFRVVLVPTAEARRFQENAVVNNSTQGGRWLHEERTNLPFRHGRVYTLEFVAQFGRIQVLLNGAPFFDFAERLPGSEIQSIDIDGDVHVHSATLH